MKKYIMLSITLLGMGISYSYLSATKMAAGSLGAIAKTITDAPVMQSTSAITSLKIDGLSRFVEYVRSLENRIASLEKGAVAVPAAPEPTPLGLVAKQAIKAEKKLGA